MQDKEISCADCGRTFLFTASEQEFFQERGMSEPKRCKDCRQARKAERQSGGRGYRQDEGRGGKRW
jgi:hypothetical protein